MVPGTKAGPFSLNNVEGDFYVCLHSFFFSIERDQPKPATFRKVTLLKHSFKKVSVSHAQLAHLSTLAKEKHMLLILNFSTLTFITNARTTMPFARLHSQMVCTQSEPAEIPQHMFLQILVQVGGDRKRRTSRTTLRTPTPLVIRHYLFTV